MVYQMIVRRGSHTYEHITTSQSNEIRRNETHLNLGSGLGQGTIKNSRGSQFQDFLNTRGVRADRKLACQLLSPFKKRWHHSYVRTPTYILRMQGSTLSLCSVSRARYVGLEDSRTCDATSFVGEQVLCCNEGVARCFECVPCPDGTISPLVSLLHLVVFV